MSKQIQFDRLDTILALATAEYMRQETEAFLSAETDITLGEETERKITRMMHRANGRDRRRKVWKVLRTVLIAALAAATVALAACVAHPEIREAIWKVVLTWGDESVKIDFVPANPNRKPGASSADNNSPTQKPNAPIPDAPKTIEAVRIPGYMPVGWTTESNLLNNCFRLSYYNADEERVITYRQSTIDANSTVDAEGATATELTVNGWDGVLLTYEDEPNVYTLYWQDYEYRYSFYGQFDSLDQLIRMAESVYVEAGGFVEEPTKTIETIYAPSYMPEGYTTESVSLKTSFMMMYYAPSEEHGFSYTQVNVDSKSRGDAEGAISTEITINEWNGILLSYEYDPHRFVLYWQDYEYRYSLSGYFESYDQLILMAESVYATSSHPTPPAEPEQPAEPANPPKSIEKVMIPGYMPVGWTVESTVVKKSFMLDYYNSSGENVITYRQRIIGSGSEADGEGATATEIKINGWNGVLLTYEDVPMEYVLYWQDTQYRYSIHGKFDSLAQLLQMAESVNNQPGSPVDEQPKRIVKYYTPGYSPYGYTPKIKFGSCSYVIDYLDQSGEYMISFMQVIINSKSYGDAEHGIASDIKICGFDGVVFRYTDYSNYYTLVWQDYEYKYVIDGLFESYEDAIRLAESVYK